jgi:hypothetical protein
MYPFKLIQFSKLHLCSLKAYIQGLGKQFYINYLNKISSNLSLFICCAQKHCQSDSVIYSVLQSSLFIQSVLVEDEMLVALASNKF